MELKDILKCSLIIIVFFVLYFIIIVTNPHSAKPATSPSIPVQNNNVSHYGNPDLLQCSTNEQVIQLTSSYGKGVVCGMECQFSTDCPSVVDNPFVFLLYVYTWGPN